VSALCRLGLHKWKIVQRYVPGGFTASVWPGIVGKCYREYKGERCKRCGAWRKEGRLYWWQWAGLVMFVGPIAGIIVWVAGWTFLGLFIAWMLLGLLAIAGLFLFIAGCA
jgi:hypothetical protein